MSLTAAFQLQVREVIGIIAEVITADDLQDAAGNPLLSEFHYAFSL